MLPTHMISVVWKYIFNVVINYCMVYVLMTSPVQNVNFEIWISRSNQIFNMKKAFGGKHFWVFGKRF